MIEIEKRAILIIPYFGKWPPYFHLFLKGCTNNKWLQILFITDCEIIDPKISNVKFIPFSSKELDELIADKLSIENYKLRFPYKLCDLKPAYGHIFAHYIKDFEYWAYGDIDLIYGNLGKYVLPKMDSGYDIISAREEIVSGSFTLVKNTNYNNTLYNKLENFTSLINTLRCEGIDETSHNETIWEGLNKLHLPKSSFTYLVAKECNENKIKASFETFICENLSGKDKIEYNLESLTVNSTEIGYFHYVMNKRKPYFTYPKWEKIPNHFFVTDTGFYKNRIEVLLFNKPKLLALSFLYYTRKLPKYIARKLKIQYT